MKVDLGIYEYDFVSHSYEYLLSHTFDKLIKVVALICHLINEDLKVLT
jgi:hypothetical protein